MEAKELTLACTELLSVNEHRPFYVMGSRLLLVTLTVFTVTVFVSSDKNSFHVSLLSMSEVSYLELDAYRRVVNVTPVVFHRDENNVSFYGLMEDLQAEFLNPQTVAIIGSGDPVVDGVASLFAACTGVPLINARNSPEMSRVRSTPFRCLGYNRHFKPGISHTSIFCLQKSDALIET